VYEGFLDDLVGPQEHWLNLHAMIADIADSTTDEDLVEQAFRLLHLFDEMTHAMKVEARRDPAGEVIFREVRYDVQIARHRVLTTLTHGTRGKPFRQSLELAATIAVRAGRPYFDRKNAQAESMRTLTDRERNLYDLTETD
jgi:hypothetical protein